MQKKVDMEKFQLQSFEVSSNTALVQVINESYKENPEKFIDGLFKMKLNQKLGLPIIGEGNPKFTHPDDKRNWDGLDLQDGIWIWDFIDPTSNFNFLQCYCK